MGRAGRPGEPPVNVEGRSKLTIVHHTARYILIKRLDPCYKRSAKAEGFERFEEEVPT